MKTSTALLMLAICTFTPEGSPAQTFPPPGVPCEPVHEGCPSDPFIEACDSCSFTEIRQKALWAPSQEGFNHVYVVDRIDREVLHYVVSVTFTSTGVNKSALDVGFTTERSQAIKTILEEGADVYEWFRTDGKIEASDLENMGIPVPNDSGFAFASDSNGTLGLEVSLGEYLNQGLEPINEWQNTLDQFETLVSEIVSKLAGIAINSESAVTFEFSDGSTVVAKITVLVDVTARTAEVTVEVDRSTLKNANGERIYPHLSSYGIGPGGGTTDPIYVGDQAYIGDLENYLNLLGGPSCTTTELECDQSGYCTATLSCD